MDNPFIDVFKFLTASTADYTNIGPWRFLVVAMYWALLLGGIYFIVRNWQEDPSQRTAANLGTALVRILLGSMWFQGMLWKLPLPVSDGLQYWTALEGTRAAFALQRELITNVVLPNLSTLGPFVFLAELIFAASFLLGFAVRLVAVIAIIYTVQLWLGFYVPGDPAEWPWTYFFLIMLMFMFVIYPAGRSLGLDAWLRRHVPAVRNREGLVGRILYLAG